MLEPGDKVLAVHRRLYESDPIRFFIGKVLDYDSGIAKVSGYTFGKDMFTGDLKKKLDLRTKLLALASGTLIVYQLPTAVVLDSLTFGLNQDGGLVLTDDHDFFMDMSESVHKKEFPT